MSQQQALIDATCKRREVSFKATNSLAERTIPLGEKTTKLTHISNKMNTAYDRMARNLSLSHQVTNEMCQEDIKIAYGTDPDQLVGLLADHADRDRRRHEIDFNIIEIENHLTACYEELVEFLVANAATFRTEVNRRYFGNDLEINKTLEMREAQAEKLRAQNSALEAQNAELKEALEQQGSD